MVRVRCSNQFGDSRMPMLASSAASSANRIVHGRPTIPEHIGEGSRTTGTCGRVEIPCAPRCRRRESGVTSVSGTHPTIRIWTVTETQVLQLELPANVKDQAASRWILQTFTDVSFSELAGAFELSDEQLIEASAKNEPFTSRIGRRRDSRPQTGSTRTRCRAPAKRLGANS